MEIQKALERFAKQDLARARRHHSMMVEDSKIGTFELTYSSGEYSATQVKGIEVVTLMKGKAASAIDFLVRNYAVSAA